jgi:hypothetical protein
MLMARVLFEQMCSLFANNPATLVLVEDVPRVRPITNRFVPGLGLAIGDLTLRTTNIEFAALELAAEIGPSMAYDPITQEYLSYHFMSDAVLEEFRSQGTPAAAFTVYGFALVTAADAALLAVQALEAPVTITRNLQFIGRPFVTFRFPTTMVR